MKNRNQIFRNADNGGGNGGSELKPGEKRETTVETSTPGQPEKKEIKHEVERGPEQK